MFLSSLSSFLLPLLASCLHIHVPGSLPLKPPPTSTPPALPPTPLCSGDSPEQRSAAAWQRASPVSSLSGDHQWDLHPCTCAKLAGGLPQSHTRHSGVCVASPIHLYLFPTLIHRVSVVFVRASCHYVEMLRCHCTRCSLWVYPLLSLQFKSLNFSL